VSRPSIKVKHPKLHELLTQRTALRVGVYRYFIFAFHLYISSFYFCIPLVCISYLILFILFYKIIFWISIKRGVLGSVTSN